MTARIKVPEAYRSLARTARKAGWRLSHCGSGHLRWSAPDGTTVITAATPSDRRTFLNERARLRRAGLPEGARP